MSSEQKKPANSRIEGRDDLMFALAVGGGAVTRTDNFLDSAKGTFWGPLLQAQKTQQHSVAINLLNKELSKVLMPLKDNFSHAVSITTGNLGQIQTLNAGLDYIISLIETKPDLKLHKADKALVYAIAGRTDYLLGSHETNSTFKQRGIDRLLSVDDWQALASQDHLILAEYYAAHISATGEAETNALNYVAYFMHHQQSKPKSVFADESPDEDKSSFPKPQMGENKSHIHTCAEKMKATYEAYDAYAQKMNDLSKKFTDIAKHFNANFEKFKSSQPTYKPEDKLSGWGNAQKEILNAARPGSMPIKGLLERRAGLKTSLFTKSPTEEVLKHLIVHAIERQWKAIQAAFGTFSSESEITVLKNFAMQVDTLSKDLESVFGQDKLLPTSNKEILKLSGMQTSDTSMPINLTEEVEKLGQPPSLSGLPRIKVESAIEIMSDLITATKTIAASSTPTTTRLGSGSIETGSLISTTRGTLFATPPVALSTTSTQAPEGESARTTNPVVAIP